METHRTIAAIRNFVSNARQSKKSIALVPTMGFLHDGHLSLVKKGFELADCVVVSIFVNPTQFGPQEDLAAYPRDEARDLKLLQSVGTDAVFLPDAGQIYPQGFQTTVSLAKLPHHMCGLSRPGHFDGVATVVAKLLGIVRPDVAIFGEKDFQQLLVIRQMVADLNLGAEIVGAPIVREADGLAMSSRNMYLDAGQRETACSLFQALTEAKQMVAEKESRVEAIVASAAACIGAHPNAQIDYIAVCDPQTLESIETIEGPALMALAVRVGRARLIDNMILHP